jgi:Kef-type K+ transport system membrane component KefB
MFLVGMGLDTGLLRGRGRGAAYVSLVGIVVPFVLGGALAGVLVGDPRYFSATVRPMHAVLFLGAAMSVTAFPVLARIIEERGLLGTPIGTLALAAASIDDAAAWCLLAVILASIGGDATIALRALLGAVTYAAAVWFLVRPLLRRLGEKADLERRGGGSFVSFVLILLLAGAWFTHEAGLHAVFGAFVLGLAVPRGVVARELRRRLESLTTHLLLPLFFAYSGLHTTIGLLNTPGLWAVASLAFLAACLGKGVACAAVARLTGESSREALAVGALMNARGLMELIILNIGLERGLITGTLFTIMVMMALATTFMASPMFDLAYDRRFLVSHDRICADGTHT